LREDEIQLARTVHYGFMPRSFSNEQLDVAVDLLPQSDIGGDYCSIFPVDEDRLIVSLCDALGHGVAAALYAARVNTYVLTHAADCRHPCQLIESLNEFLCAHLPFSGMYATFYSIFFDRPGGSMTFAGAGHPPALHYEQATGLIHELPSETIMVGVSHPLAVACSVNRRRVASGDKVLLYTDGLSESRTESGALFGPQGVGAFLGANHALGGKEFNERLLDQVTHHEELVLDDDVIVMTITVK